MSRKRLIVNADDFGLSPGVNAGIARAHREGILTSTSLMANGPAFAGAVELAKRFPSLGVGVHLNIVRGKPLGEPARLGRLVGGDGSFRRFRWRWLSRAFLAQAEAEYRRQIDKVIAAGINPTHIDFEKHHAWQPALYGLACRLAKEYGITAIRRLSEPVWWSIRQLGWPGFADAFMAAALRCGTSLQGGSGGLFRPDRFLGQTHIGRMDEAVWLRLLACLPDGVSEVMTHPSATADAEAGDLGASRLAGGREAELAALVSPKVRAEAEKEGIELVNYRTASSSRGGSDRG